MCSNITTQHIEDLKLVLALSIAVDESCDINDSVKVSLFVRFMSHSGPEEELLGLLLLKGQTRGEDIAIAVIECMDKHHISLDKIMSISTDGAKSMASKRFVGKHFRMKFVKVMELVIPIINSILAKALNHRQFKEFLFEMECADLLLYNKLTQHKWFALNGLEKEDMMICNAWNSIPDSYDELKKLAFAVVSLLGSTYISEQSFSSMNIIKSKLRSSRIDENLESCLKLKTTYKPDLLKLSKEMQAHCSH
ncbi:uncharacterized protein TNCV_3614271 [Trichonephila clavipes]|uniref:HAT C-terminal dimerisation domain-containing protein n=1 Tax=Trichonephila clavipes TaxID=2585209 RepID=A0A8X6SWJ9_TRICX|nr:uncharacterized protein TNCV_3614271 [Trichonephila clavipes]